MSTLILHKDIEAYKVGDVIFERDEFPRNAYRRARAESLETGTPIETIGPRSTWDRETKKWVR